MSRVAFVTVDLNPNVCICTCTSFVSCLDGQVVETYTDCKRYKLKLPLPTIPPNTVSSSFPWGNSLTWPTRVTDVSLNSVMLFRILDLKHGIQFYYLAYFLDRKPSKACERWRWAVYICNTINFFPKQKTVIK